MPVRSPSPKSSKTATPSNSAISPLSPTYDQSSLVSTSSRRHSIYMAPLVLRDCEYLSAIQAKKQTTRNSKLNQSYKHANQIRNSRSNGRIIPLNKLHGNQRHTCLDAPISSTNFLLEKLAQTNHASDPPSFILPNADDWEDAQVPEFGGRTNTPSHFFGFSLLLEGIVTSDAGARIRKIRRVGHGPLRIRHRLVSVRGYRDARDRLRLDIPRQ